MTFDFSSILSYLGVLIGNFWSALLNLIEAIPNWLWSMLQQALVYLFSLIPEPSFIHTAATTIQGDISAWTSAGGTFSGVAYLLGLVRFDVALSYGIGALLCRFLIRRLPFIG